MQGPRLVRPLFAFSKGPALPVQSSAAPFLNHIGVVRPGAQRSMATAMAKRLEGKSIVITGASSGIGKSTGSADQQPSMRQTLTQSSTGIRANLTKESQIDLDRKED